MRTLMLLAALLLACTGRLVHGQAPDFTSGFCHILMSRGNIRYNAVTESQRDTSSVSVRSEDSSTYQPKFLTQARRKSRLGAVGGPLVPRLTHEPIYEWVSCPSNAFNGRFACARIRWNQDPRSYWCADGGRVVDLATIKACPSDKDAIVWAVVRNSASSYTLVTRDSRNNNPLYLAFQHDGAGWQSRDLLLTGCRYCNDNTAFDVTIQPGSNAYRVCP